MPRLAAAASLAAAAAVAALLAAGPAAAKPAPSPSPVGTWQAQIKGVIKGGDVVEGLCHLTFNADPGQTVTGYALVEDSDALSSLSGTWSVDLNGKLIGALVVDGQTYPYLGKAVAGKSLQFKFDMPEGRISVKGRPDTPVEDDITGQSTGTLSR